MELLVDENIRGTTLERLYADGHDIARMKDMAAGESDELVLERALNSGRILITSDKDFGELVFLRGMASGGVVLLRVSRLPALERAELVSRTLAELGSGLRGHFTVVAPNSTRVRPLPTDD